MENLEHLRKSAKLKLIIMCLATIIPIISIVILEFSFLELRSFNSVISDLLFARYNILILLEAYIITKIFDYIKIFTLIDYATSEVIKKNDGRIKFIKLKTESMTIKIFIYLISIALIVTTFCRYIFYTLLGVLLAVFITYFSILIYYSKKY